MALPLDHPPALTARMLQTVWRRKPRASWSVDCSRSVPLVGHNPYSGRGRTHEEHIVKPTSCSNTPLTSRASHGERRSHLPSAQPTAASRKSDEIIGRDISTQP